jgi:hypothetical protein
MAGGIKDTSFPKQGGKLQVIFVVVVVVVVVVCFAVSGPHACLGKCSATELYLQPQVTLNVVIFFSTYAILLPIE